MKVGRNDPCPCGSGRKHKRCCAAVAVATLTAPGGAGHPRFLGYARAPDDGADGAPPAGWLCMVFPVGAAELGQLPALAGHGFAVGDWGVATEDAAEGTTVHGPFASFGDAVTFAESTTGAAHFAAAPADVAPW